jgi:hypothetical protein
LFGEASGRASDTLSRRLTSGGVRSCRWGSGSKARDRLSVWPRSPACQLVGLGVWRRLQMFCGQYLTFELDLTNQKADLLQAVVDCIFGDLDLQHGDGRPGARVNSIRFRCSAIARFSALQ